NSYEYDIDVGGRTRDRIGSAAAAAAGAMPAAKAAIGGLARLDATNVLPEHARPWTGYRHARRAIPARPGGADQRRPQRPARPGRRPQPPLRSAGLFAPGPEF